MNVRKASSNCLTASLSAAIIASDYGSPVSYAMLAVGATLAVLLMLAKYMSPGPRSRPSVGSEREQGRFGGRTLRYSWVVMVVVWLYGTVLGLAKSVPPDYVFRNFFGMVVYLILPVMFAVELSLRQIFWAILTAGVYNIIHLGLASIDFLVLYGHEVEYSSLSELRVIYSNSAIAMFPLIAVSAASVFHPKWTVPDYASGIKCHVYTGLASFVSLALVTILSSMSKGLITLVALMTIMAALFGGLDYIRHKRFPIPTLLVLAATIAAFAVLPTSTVDKIAFTFGSEESSNSLRAEQAAYLLDELSITGAGLGAKLESGYMRDDTGYGFELTYLNLLHKVGITAVAIYFIYLATITIGLKRILAGRLLFESYFALGLMAYLVQGAANPILFSPASVVLHCMAIYLLVTTSGTATAAMVSFSQKRRQA